MLENINSIISFTGLSVSQFAHFYKIPLRSVQRWHRGEHRPPAYLITMLNRLVEMDFPVLRSESEAAPIIANPR